jgi:hypothetical protein
MELTSNDKATLDQMNHGNLCAVCWEFHKWSCNCKGEEITNDEHLIRLVATQKVNLRAMGFVV